MRRIIAAAAAAILALTPAAAVTALAKDGPGFALTTDGTEIVAEYHNGMPSSAIVSFLVLPPQAYDLDLNEADGSEIAALAVYYDQLQQEPGGGYQFRADLGSDGISGRYRVIAQTAGSAEEATVLYLKAGEDIAGIVAGVNAARTKTDVNTALSGNKYLLDINVTYDSAAFKQYSDEILEEFIRRRGSGFADEQALKSAFDQAGMFVFANHTADADALYQLSAEGMSLEKYGLAEQYRADYDVYQQQAYRILIEIRNETAAGRFQTEEEFLKSYREALGVCKINAIAIRSEMTKALETYEPILQLGLSGGYASVDPVEVAKALIGKNFKTRNQLKNAFDKAVADAKKKDPSQGSHTGSGTSSGGGGNRGGLGVTGTGDFAVDHAVPQQTPEPSVDFTDLTGAEWARESIAALAAAGVLSGYPDGTFRPFQKVTREEFVKMVVLASGTPVTDEAAVFEDVEPAEWYAPYISAAVRQGLVYGVSETRFGIGEQLTREDMATLVSRVLENRGITDGGGAARVFADENEIAEYAKEPVAQLQRMGIINGDESGIFRPRDASDRAQTAKVIAGMMKYLGE